MTAMTCDDGPGCFGSYGRGGCPMSDECTWARECCLCALVYGVRDEEESDG